MTGAAEDGAGSVSLDGLYRAFSTLCGHAAPLWTSEEFGRWVRTAVTDWRRLDAAEQQVLVYAAYDAAYKQAFAPGPEQERQETVLSDQAPQLARADGQGLTWTPGDVLVSFRRADGWYASVTGVGNDGWTYESDDFGPYPTRDDAERAAREHYAAREQ